MRGALVTLGLATAGLLWAGCGARIGEAEGGAADAASEPDARPVADAAPTADAEIVAPPCVEGDQRTTGDDGTCYMLFYDAVDRDSAQAQCQGLGGDLAVIESAGEQAVVAELAALHPVDLPDSWLGGSDQQQEGTWVWPGGAVFYQGGAAVLFENFRAEEPNDNDADCALGPGEDCLIIEGDVGGTWDDRCCARLSPYICER